MKKRIAQLINSSSFKRYAVNTSWLMGEKVLRMVVGLFIGIWVARYLGPEQFGLFSYAQSLVFLFTAIATLGLDAIIVRELVKDESQRDKLLGTAFGLKLLGAILILPVLGLSVQFTGNDDFTNLLVFIIASATIFQSFNVIDFYYQSKVLSKYVALANTISLALSSFIKIVLILNQAPIVAFAIIVVLDALILSLGLVYFYIKTSKLNIFSWKFDWHLAKSLLKDSWPMILSGIAISFYMKIDQIMVKELLDAEAVGYYAAAVKLTEMWLFITVAITTSLFPAVLKAKEIGENLYYQRLLNLYRLLILIAVIISIGMSLLSYQVVAISFGEAYLPAVSILIIYIWSNVFVFMNNGSWKWYLVENLQKIAMIRLMIGAIVNVGLNLILINLYGLTGAAIATLISYAVAVYFCNLISKKTWINFKLLSIALVTPYRIWRVK